MLKIGLTGGIGSGKSVVGTIFAALGVPVYEADKEARRLMERDQDMIREIKGLFGLSAYDNGKLNREYIGRIVFADKKILNLLNAIVHPAVQKDFKNWTHQFDTAPYVVEEAAILFESGSAKQMDYIIFVKADLQTRINRVVQRDKVSAEDVLARMESQLDESEKERQSDFIILNENGSMILPQIVDLHNKIVNFKR